MVCWIYIEVSKVSESLQQRGQAIDMQGSEDEGEEMKWRWREERGDNVEITSPGTDSIAFWHRSHARKAFGGSWLGSIRVLFKSSPLLLMTTVMT